MTLHALSTSTEALGARRLDGQVAIVTGASGGIGLETARTLAAAGSIVTLAVRDAAKGEAALRSIIAAHPDARVEIGELDLTSLASVRSFAKQFRETHDHLDLLVNNAGVMFPPLTRTAGGHELQFGTNHLGHFALTSGLISLLLGASTARIVNVSSAGHSMAGIDFDDPNFERREYDRLEGYGQSKTANILFAAECDRRYGANGVRSFSLHPGMIGTDLGRHMDEATLARVLDRAKQRAQTAGAADASGMPTFKSIEQGAATSIYACVDESLADHGAAYLSDCALAVAEDWATSIENAEQLWELSQDLVAMQFGMDA